MKRLVPVFVFCLLWCVSCEQNDPKRGGDSSLNQPSDPASWSPVGKTYVCDTVWQNSPAEDKYWGWVIHFFSKDSCVKYETPNRDLTYHECALQTIDSSRYDMHYPTADYYSTVGGTVDFQFKDTTQIFVPASGVNGLSYILIFK